jgi:large subunit ribosomal protein L4
MKLAVVDQAGKELRKLDVDDSVFGIEPNMAVLHQAYVRQRNNNRQGNAKTKTRGEVQGSTRKIRMQKYTGRARAGGNRAPTRVGGGVVFGPRPRSYERDMPKKMRRLAIRSALSGKVADGQLVIIDQLALETPKTKEMIRLLSAVGFERSALVVTGAPDKTVTASVRNLERAKALPAAYLNVLDMMNHAGLVMTEEAIRVAETLWGLKTANGGKPIAARRHSETIGVEKPRVEARSKEEIKADKKVRADARAQVAEDKAAAAVAEAAAEEKTKKAKAPKGEKRDEALSAEAKAEEPATEARVAPAAEVKAEETPVAEAKAEAPAEKKPKAAKAEAPAAQAKAEKAPAAEAPAAETEAPAAEAAAEEAPKPKRTRTTKPKAEASTEDKPAAGAEEKPKRAPRKKKTEESE